MIYTFNETESDYIEACKSGLVESKAVFEVYLEELKENDVTPDNEATQDNSISKSNVWVVQEDELDVKEDVARIVEKQGLEAIILSEQANRGKTIIEKFVSRPSRCTSFRFSMSMFIVKYSTFRPFLHALSPKAQAK